VSFDPVANGGPAPARNTNPPEALGPPLGTGSVSLGNGGQLVLEFVDNVLMGDGTTAADLHIFEVGNQLEETFVEISQDGVTWINVGGTSGGTSSLDIDAAGIAPTDQFRFVRITDNANQGSTDPNVDPDLGADIDGVGAITTVVTLVPTGIGIEVTDNASPTILNNIVADSDTGISIDASSQSTVVGGTLYQANATDTAGVGNEDFPLYLDGADPLFRDSDAGNYYLAPLSQAIDSSVGSLLDRFDIEQVKNQIGISDSPILAPATDVTGQLRVDDPEVETPAGFGENVFIDRGAVDRADFVGPTASTVKPRDNDADGLDQNPSPTAVELADGSVYSSFRFRLLDGVPPADPNLGSGIDDTTVVSSNVTVSRNGVPLEDTIDYSYSYNATSDTVVLTPISGIWQDNSTYTIAINNTDSFQLVPKPGSELNDGESFAVVAGTTSSDTYEFESGYKMQIPQTFALQVPEAGGSLGGIADRQTFTIQRLLPGGTQQTEVFEFDSNGVWVDNNADNIPDNHVVSFNVASSPEEIADAIVEQILVANLALSPRHIGEGLVHLGSTSDYIVDVRRSPNLTLTGQASGVEDGDSFSVDDGSKVVTFEFDSDGELADDDGDGQPDNPDASVIHFRAAETHDEIAASVITAIDLAALGLEPSAVGDGVIHLGGTPNVHQANLAQSNLVLIGEPGVRSAWGLQIPTAAGMPRTTDDGSGLPYLSDGDTFTITDGTSSITFELDDLDDPIGGGFSTAPNTVVAYRSGSSTPDQIAAVLVAAIQSAPLTGLTPVNNGNGIVLLGELADGSPNHSIDVSQTGLSEVGSASIPAAVPVDFLPHETFDGGQVAVSLIQSINGNGSTVTARAGGGDLIIVEGATAVSEIHPVFVSNTYFEGVKDLAGNDLKPNLLSGETRSTIVLGGVNMDFGDAPQTAGGDYPTQLGQNGAIHVITGSGLALGARVDPDADGQVSAAVDGDDLDSEGFVVDLPDPNPSPPTKPGPTNVWLDWMWNPLRNATTPTTILLPQPLTLQVGDGTVIQDGDQFRPGNSGSAVTFEFDDGSGILSDPNNVVIDFDGSETVDEIADRVVTIVKTRPELGLTPVNLGNGTVHLGGDSLSVHPPGTGLSSSGIANPIADEEWFTIDADPGAGVDLYTFEFEDTNEDDGVGAGNIPVLFDVTTTQEGYAQSLIDSILNARLGIGATYLGDGVVELAGDDDDGVIMGAFNPLTETELVITASAEGLLDAWIDFNIDGDFNDPGEQIFASQQLAAGENTFAVQPPAPPNTKTGTTVGRFRISSDGGLLPTGLAADGEVEDYQVNILAGNPPVAHPDQFVFSEDEIGLNPAPVSVLANDTDADGPGDEDILTVASYQSTTELGATVIVDTSSNPATKGILRYYPLGSAILQGLDAGETMNDTFTYRAKDAMFLSSAGTVTITVIGENDAPTAGDDVQVFTDQRTPIDVDVLANDTDPENHPLTIVLGSVAGEAGDAYVYEVQTVTLGGTAGTGTLSYNGVDGTTPLTFDPGVAPTAAQVRAHLNSIPQLANNTNVVGVDGGPFTVGFQGNLADVDASELVASTTDGAQATVATVGNRLRYDPDGEFDALDQGETGADSFTYLIDDGNGGFDTGTVTVTISGLNDPPVAVDDVAPEAATDEATLTIVDVLANDYDPEDDPGTKTITVTAVQTVVTRGTVDINSPGTQNNTVTYDPDGQFESLAVGQTGTDVFQYLVQDTNGNSSMGEVTMTISGVNDDPVAVDDTGVGVPRNGTVDINVLANDTDIDVGDAASLSVQLPLDLSLTLGIASVNPDGTIKYDPNGMFDHLQIGQFAQDRFAYTAADGHGGTSAATVTVTIFGASDPPIGLDDVATTTEDDSVEIAVLLNDTDDFGPKIVTAVDQTGLQGSVVINPQDTPNNVVIYSPDGQFDTLAEGDQATETFTYTVSDMIGEDTATVTVTVTGVNDAPIANIDANGYVAQRGKTLFVNDENGTDTPGVPGDDRVLLNDTDAEGDALRAVLVTPPQHATANGFTLNADGTFSYTHNGGAASADTFQYVAFDAHNAQSDQTVTVVINIVDATAAEWQNSINRYDIDNSGYVSPIDVLLAINYINANFPNTTLPSPRPIGAPFYDVTGDGQLNPEDILQVIIEVNSQNTQGEGEYYARAEGESNPSSPEIIVPPMANVTLSSPDQDAQPSGDSELRSPYVPPEPARGQTNGEATVHVDPFDVEDVLSSIAEDVNGSLAERTPLDDLLQEMLG